MAEVIIGRVIWTKEYIEWDTDLLYFDIGTEKEYA